MTPQRVTRAIVLAAGFGSRLRQGSGAQNAAAASNGPKPLRDVAGVPLLVRVLRSLEAAGIKEAVIVIGYEGESIRKRLMREPSLGLELRFVKNDDYERANGVSLLKAASYIDRDCILTMSDHLYSPELVERVIAAGPLGDRSALGVDYDIERCFDLDDATKVLTRPAESGGTTGIAKINKELTEFDAIDTGVFLIGPAFVEALRAVESERGDASLSDGVRRLSEQGRFFVQDVGDVRWIDVDTPQALERAEAMLRVFGDQLGDVPGSMLPPPPIDPQAIEQFAPSWVRAAQPYNEDHFALADSMDNAARLMSNENPFGPSPRVIQAIVEAATLGNRYPGGAAALRTRIGARDGLAENNVIMGAGSTELIDVIIRTFVGPGEEVLLNVPTFSMYEARTRTTGGIPVLIPVNEAGDYDVGAIIRRVNERSKLLFLCSPNNPTGRRMPEADLRRLLSLGLPTVIDEAYGEFGDGSSHSHLLREFPNAIVLRTFSKAYGLAGMRLGYALAHENIIHLMRRVKVPWNIPTVTIAAACALLDEQSEFATRMIEMEQLRSTLAKGIQAIPGLRVLPGEGNYVLVDVAETGRRARDIVASLLSDGVLIRDLSAHHSTQNHVRVTVGTADDNQRCVSGLARVLSGPRHATPSYVTVGTAE